MNYMHINYNRGSIKIKQKIENLISENSIYYEGTQDAPQCGFSMAVSNVLKHQM